MACRVKQKEAIRLRACSTDSDRCSSRCFSIFQATWGLEVIARCSSLVCVLGVLFLAGCGNDKADVSKERLEQMSGGTLKETIAVSGKILVDGTGEKGVKISLYSANGAGPVSTCTTGDNGVYCWSTYLDCDGLAAGNYRLGFEYIPKQKKNDSGVDLFNGKYANPTENDFQLTVEAGSPKSDANFELTSN